MSRAVADPPPLGDGVVDLLLWLREAGVVLWTEQGRLRFEAPAGVMTDEIRERVAQRRAEVIAFLAEADVAERTSVWIGMPDGVRLAADVFRPKRHGVTISEPLPVIWCHERYRRAEAVAGGIMTKLDAQPWLKELLRHEYVVVVVDVRGSGASEGVRPVEFAVEETQDAYAVTEWLAAQQWCTGRVGMFGMSYSGVAQLLAAGAAPPHLAAIVPQMALFDLFAFLRPGGVFRDNFARAWSELVHRLDTQPGAARADARTDVAATVAAHQHNVDVFAQAARLKCRDSRDEATGRTLYEELNPAGAIARISASGVPICHLSGWYDIWVRDTTLWFRNLTNPQRMIIGPWSHNSCGNDFLATEHLRWYDRWLKDIDNGVTDEPPVRYFTMSAPPGTQWRSSAQWPPAQVRPTEFFFRAGPAATISSVNDGLLTAVAPTDPDGVDVYRVDYTTTTGRTTRWADGYGGGFRYHLTPNDRKALTYTTPVLSRDVEVTGHPVVHLWVSADQPDADFFVYLEEVDERGESHYVSEAVIRASYRACGPAPYDTMGLPFLPGVTESVQPLPAEPVELVADLHPTSNVFVAGRRLRVSVTGCDRDNADTPRRVPPPVVRIHRSARYLSRVVLPIMPSP
ncbi:CocE/NonD family hydrolase [Micromonospora sp. FIMYZ51]|uniref:CocE/NonD family hydrolase n=1 Tax=Micromonospora sp. FIMYZ51 TaxID=3051832 RepID=UPI00311FB1D8